MSDPVWTPVAPGLRKKPTAKPSLWSYQSTLCFDGLQNTKTMMHASDRDGKKWHRGRESDLDAGVKPADKTMTFRQLKEMCFAEIEAAIVRDGGEAYGIKAHTFRNYGIALRRFPEDDPLWRLTLDKLDDVAITRFLKRLREEHKSEKNPKGYEWKTLHETATVVRTILRYGRDEGHMRVDPFATVARKWMIPQHANEENVKEALAPREIRAIVEAAKSPAFVEQTDTLLTNLVIQAFCEGERIGETRTAHWRDADLVHGILTTRGTKNARSRKRPQAAQEETLRAWERQLEHELSKGLGGFDDFIYTQPNGEPVTQDQARVAIERAGKLAGLGHVTPMNARKSVSTADTLAGVDEERSAAKLGHTVAVKRAHYVRPPADLEALQMDRDKRAAYLNFEEEA